MSGLKRKEVEGSQSLRLWIKRASLLLCIFSFKIHASELVAQLHTHLGMVKGSFSGATTKEFSVSNALNLEYEIFRSSKDSMFGKSIIAMSSETGKLVYYYTGFGRKYYVKSSGVRIDETNTRDHVISQPKWRYYWGWDLGVSQVIVDEIGEALSVVATMIDMGGHGGAIYTLNRSWGLEAQLGMSYGYGFSTVAVTGTIQKLFFGGVYNF